MVAPALLKDVDPDAQRMLVTVRVILAVAANRELRLDVAAIAEATGLTVDAVRDALRSDVYMRVMGEQAQLLCAHALVRGLERMATIIDAPSAKPKDRIDAFRAIVQTAQVMTKLPQAAASAAPEQDLKRWTEQFGQKVEPA